MRPVMTYAETRVETTITKTPIKNGNEDFKVHHRQHCRIEFATKISKIQNVIRWAKCQQNVLRIRKRA